MKVLPIRPPRPADAPHPALPPDRHWRFERVLSAPHRLGFFAAALLLAISALWWTAALAARAVGLALPWAVPPPIAHGLLMSLGFMPLFITGFLFTAGPRWLARPDVDAATLRAPVALIVGGWALALVGFHAAGPLAAAGVSAVTLGWAWLVGCFVGVLRASTAPDRLHARLIAGAGGIGVLALLLAAVGLGRDDPTLARAATQIALWGFLAPTFAVVSHRMIPFFTASALPALEAWRPNALLAPMLGVLWLEAGFAVAELLDGPLPAAARWVQVGFEAPAAALLLWLAWRWGLVQSLRIRLLAMLHAGFVWLGLALLLAAASHTMMAGSADARSLGLAPLHALGMGYLGATLVAMITRVASGHSGRPLAADDFVWRLYWILQLGVLLRVAAALWPEAPAALLLAAVAAWSLAAVGWAVRYGRWLGRPRIDGRPG